MKYPMDVVLAKLEKSMAASTARAKAANDEEQANYEKLARDAVDYVERAQKHADAAAALMQAQQYKKASKEFYEAYRIIDYYRGPGDRPEYGNAGKQYEIAASEMQGVIDMLKATGEQFISTSEMEKMNILPIMRYR